MPEEKWQEFMGETLNWSMLGWQEQGQGRAPGCHPPLCGITSGQHSAALGN